MITTLIELSPIHTGIALLVHSATGTKETPLMNSCAEAFRARGYTVIRFDAHHGMGEQGGDFSAFTPTAIYEDLEDLLQWIRVQEWWQPNLALCGHSIGGLVAAHYAATHPAEVHTLTLIAPTVSGDSYIRAYQQTDAEGLERWRTDGTRTVLHPLSGEPYAFSYSFVKDACKYDLVPEAHQIHAPTHVFVGTRDKTAPESECRLFAEACIPHARLTVLGALPHTPTESHDLTVLYRALVSM
jgi:pimeloyl-ACP methyl ester carboxylesterase